MKDFRYHVEVICYTVFHTTVKMKNVVGTDVKVIRSCC